MMGASINDSVEGITKEEVSTTISEGEGASEEALSSSSKDSNYSK